MRTIAVSFSPALGVRVSNDVLGNCALEGVLVCRTPAKMSSIVIEARKLPVKLCVGITKYEFSCSQLLAGLRREKVFPFTEMDRAYDIC